MLVKLLVTGFSDNSPIRKVAKNLKTKQGYRWFAGYLRRPHKHTGRVPAVLQLPGKRV